MTQSWTPARVFMLVASAVHVPLGIIGLLVNQAFPVGASAAARADSHHVFGIFMTNGWHSLAALGLGIVMAYYAVYPRRAREAALLIGLMHVGIVVAFAVWDPSTFWFASNGADQIIHASTAIGGIGSALLTRTAGSRVAAPARGV